MTDDSDDFDEEAYDDGFEQGVRIGKMIARKEMRHKLYVLYAYGYTDAVNSFADGPNFAGAEDVRARVNEVKDNDLADVKDELQDLPVEV